MNDFISNAHKVFAKYDSKDYDILDKTLDELIQNGYPKGCFQDYTVLVDIISILVAFNDAVKQKNGGETV